MDFTEHLRHYYFKHGHPLYLASVRKIYDYYEGLIPEDDIIEVISQHDPYSIHKEFKEGQRNISYSNFKRYQFQCDLIDVRHLAEYNDNVSYLFTCIDTFTRYAFVRLLETKHGSCAVKAFDSILEEAGSPPKTLVMDRGSEFYNQEFEDFCRMKNIKYYPPDSSSHGAYIERFNRTLQGIIYKFMTDHETHRYISFKNTSDIDVPMMPSFMATYNNSYHRMIGTTPAIAENNPSLHLEILKKMTEYRLKVKKKKIKYNIGDTVRIRRIKGKFGRGYDEQATQEIFKVYKIITNKPIPMYQLSDYNGTEKIHGSFYANELVTVNKSEHKIEKVLDKRRRNGVTQLLVKWKGWSDNYNSWINESDVTQTFSN